ncbi:MAG: DNA methyltransferase, partial [Fibrobacteraceae bacterium]|nr:DNA methyltransferase [Fibrobacteraceae bacterium]
MQLNRLSSRKEKHANLDCDKKKCCPKVCLKIDDCLSVLKSLPDKSVQLIIIDPPYNLDLEKWDSFPNYMDWASAWINEAYRVLSDKGSLVIFGGTQFGDERSGDLVEIIYYCRHFTKLRL